MAELKILHLTLKKKWFDMILSGEKTEEYREVKEYWNTRLCDPTIFVFKDFDIVRFTNGYGKDKPTFDIECKGIDIGPGVIAWGAETGKVYYVIKLGEICLLEVVV